MTVGPDFEKPTADLPDAWTPDDEGILLEEPPEIAGWWKSLNDPVLDKLVDLALEQNLNLEIAAVRVLESRAQLQLATGNQYPQTQVLTGDATYTVPPDSSVVQNSYWSYTFGASTSWEIDFWGKYRRGIESADAAYLASISAYDNVTTLLIAQVVTTYVVIRETEEQLRISRENITLQQRSYDITEVLYRNGEDSELDMQQALTLLLSTKATIPSLEISLVQARNAMSVLLGQPPGGLVELLEESQGLPKLPDQVAVGFPADILRRRPDVQAAELAARAQNAQVGVATANLYPSFGLSGFVGATAGGPGDDAISNLFQSDAITATAGPNFVWPFLNYGRLKSNIRVQDARLQQALLTYRDTVINAAAEVEDALASFTGTRDQAVLLVDAVESAIRSNELSSLRYREGFSDYQRVLDSQQRLFTEQQRYISNQGNTLRSLVSIYLALGLGWEHRDGAPPIDDETREAMDSRIDWGHLLEETSEEQAEDGTE
jgi:NodT family efflux transporter outer membrane factor (OMF) lipoprotein